MMRSNNMLVKISLAATFCIATSGAIAQQKVTSMVAALPPVAAYLPVLVGIEKGFFKEQSIDLTVNPNIVGGQLIPALLSGDIQVAGNIWALVALGIAQGLPIKGVTGMSSGGTSTSDDDIQVISMRKSGIKSPADLAGKTVAMNTLRNLSEVSIRRIAEKAGIDPNSIKVTPVLFPNQISALRAGKVDAAVISEPFLTLAKQQEDINVIAAANVAIQPLAPIGMMAMSAEYIKNNPDVVRRFQLAVRKSVEYTAANETETRSYLVKYTKVPPEIAAKMTLPRYKAVHELKDIQAEVDLLVKFKILDKNLDMTSYVVPMPK